MFVGLNDYADPASARLKISTLAKKIKEQIISTKLNTFDINYNLNIIPEFVAGTLSYIFTNQPSQTSEIQINVPNQNTDFGYLRILPPGTEFVIGQIYNGTQVVEQICDAFDFYNDKGSC